MTYYEITVDHTDAPSAYNHPFIVELKAQSLTHLNQIMRDSHPELRVIEVRATS